MTCTSFTAQPGVFGDSLVWATPTSNPWSFKVEAGANTTGYTLLRSGSPVTKMELPTSFIVRWAFFPGATFAALRGADVPVAGSATFRLFLFDLRSTSIRPLEIVNGPYTTLGSTPDLEVRPSPDSRLVFVYIS